MPRRAKFWPLVLSLETQRSARINWKAFEYCERLKRIFAYVSDHPQEPLSLRKAAGLANLERVYFSKYFQRNVGVSLKYWVDFLRVQRAAKLLRESDKSVLEIAFEVGFMDPSTFIRVFCRIAGTTPQRYRDDRKPSAGGSVVRSQEDNNRR